MKRVYEASEYERKPGNEYCIGCGRAELRRDLRRFKDGVERDCEGEIIATHYICGDCKDELVLLND